MIQTPSGRAAADADRTPRRRTFGLLIGLFIICITRLIDSYLYYSVYQRYDFRRRPDAPQAYRHNCIYTYTHRTYYHYVHNTYVYICVYIYIYIYTSIRTLVQKSRILLYRTCRLIIRSSFRRPVDDSWTFIR